MPIFGEGRKIDGIRSEKFMYALTKENKEKKYPFLTETRTNVFLTLELHRKKLFGNRRAGFLFYACKGTTMCSFLVTPPPTVSSLMAASRSYG